MGCASPAIAVESPLGKPRLAEIVFRPSRQAAGRRRRASTVAMPARIAAEKTQAMTAMATRLSAFGIRMALRSLQARPRREAAPQGSTARVPSSPRLAQRRPESGGPAGLDRRSAKTSSARPEVSALAQMLRKCDRTVASETARSSATPVTETPRPRSRQTRNSARLSRPG